MTCYKYMQQSKLKPALHKLHWESVAGGRPEVKAARAGDAHGSLVDAHSSLFNAEWLFQCVLVEGRKSARDIYQKINNMYTNKNKQWKYQKKDLTYINMC